MSIEDLELRLAAMEQASEELRTQTALANEATAKLRRAHADIKQLLETDIPKIVAEAVDLSIHRSKIAEHRGRSR